MQFRKEQARKCTVQERAPQEGKCTVCSEKNGQESVQFMKSRLRRKKFREQQARKCSVQERAVQEMCSSIKSRLEVMNSRKWKTRKYTFREELASKEEVQKKGAFEKWKTRTVFTSHSGQYLGSRDQRKSHNMEKRLKEVNILTK
jgi:hypothetical protein